MDFGLAKKHSKEVEQRRREAKRKLDQQRRDSEIQKVMEEGQREREEQRVLEEQEERRRAEEEALLNDGVRFLQRLRPYPVARADDKLVLPASALETLERQGALDGGVLTFTVAIPPGPAKTAGGLTHAGVAEFVAEEGTVGVPPRVALCLTKGAGLDSLAAVGSVEVRFTRLSRSTKSTVKFQPRGEGFHAGGKDAMRMDLEHVLLESLRGHTALTEGDWLPVRHNGVTYELLVRELAPEPQILLLDTDLTVEVLPSEQTEAEVRAEEERKAKEEAAAREAEEREQARILRAKQKALALPPEPPAGQEAVQLLLRLPEGGRLQRRFLREGPLQTVLDWVESEEQTRVGAGDFHVVQKWPGHMREFGSSEASQSLAALSFGRQEALFLQRAGEAQVPLEPEDDKALTAEAQAANEKRPEGLVEYWKRPNETPGITVDTTEWTAAEERALAMLDRRIERQETPTTAATAEPTLEDLRGEELVGVFERLVAFGMPPKEAAMASKKYSAQLRELGNMGFDDWPEAVRLLDKYQGRILRVANALAERMAESGEPSSAPISSTAPPPTSLPVPASAPAAPTPSSAPPAVDKQAVAAKFQELVKGGMDPNEAATQAILFVRQAAATSNAAATPPAEVQPSTAAAAPVAQANAPEASFAEKMTELAAMGFVDEVRNEALLKKYAGRIERVIEALCSG